MVGRGGEGRGRGQREGQGMEIRKWFARMFEVLVVWKPMITTDITSSATFGPGDGGDDIEKVVFNNG